MRKFVNGELIDLTAEEVAEYERLSAEYQPPEDPNEKRMNEIEGALIELAAMLGGA